MELSRRAAIVGSIALLLAVQTTLAAEAPTTALITGANRGIGFEFTKQYAERGYRVIATARDPAKATELQALAKKHKLVSIEKLDVTDLVGIDALAAKLKGTPIDLLVNNAGISGGVVNQNFGTIKFSEFDGVMRTNVQGPLKMAEAFIDHVAASRLKKLVVVTSGAGSLAGATSSPGGYFYRASKAAVNIEMRNVAMAVKDRGVIVCMTAPGLTDTDFTAEMPKTAQMGSPVDRTKGMIDVIDKCTMAQSGIPIAWDGKVIPW